MRFHERYTVTHGIESLVLPAWVCTCGGEVFVRREASDFSGAAMQAAPNQRGRQELRRWLSTLHAQIRASSGLGQAPRDRVREVMRLHADTLISMAAVDDDGRYVAANHAACALLGYSQADLLDRTIWEVSAPPLVSNHREMWRVFLLRGSAEGRYRLRRRTGELIVVNYASVSHMLPGVHVSVMATRALLQHIASGRV